MRLGKRTARLVREAAVMGFVQGSMWGEVQGHKPRAERSPHPKDSEVLDRVMLGARKHSDLYPALSKVEYEPLPRPDLLKALLDQRGEVPRG
jgi:hypothetical protein